MVIASGAALSIAWTFGGTGCRPDAPVVICALKGAVLRSGRRRRHARSHAEVRVARRSTQGLENPRPRNASLPTSCGYRRAFLSGSRRHAEITSSRSLRLPDREVVAIRATGRLSTGFGIDTPVA